MSLDKAILHGKEKRKPYRRAKAVSLVCRRNECPHCLKNALYANAKRLASSKDQDE